MMKRQSNIISPKDRKLLFAQQDGKCHYCTESVQFRRKHDDDYGTVDHIVPKAKGGRDEYHNYVGSCMSCNNAKGNMDYDIFMEICRGKNRKQIAETIRTLKTIPLDVMIRDEFEKDGYILGSTKKPT